MNVILIAVFVFTLNVIACQFILSIGILLPEQSLDENYIYNLTVEMAVKNFNVTGSALKYNVKKLNCEDTVLVTGKSSEFFYHENVDVIIGPDCKKGCDITMNGAEYVGAMMISYDCTDYDNVQSKNFARVKPFIDNAAIIAEYYSTLANQYNWKILGILFSSNLFQNIAIELKELLVAQGFTVREIDILNYENISYVLVDVENSMRIILTLICEEDVIKFMVEAKKKGWLNSSLYGIINVNFDPIAAEKAKIKLKIDEDLDKLMIGTFQMRASTVEDDQTEEYLNFKNIITNKYIEKFGAQNWDGLNKVIISASYIYDSILLYLKNAERLVEMKHQQYIENSINQLKKEWYKSISKNTTLCKIFSVTQENKSCTVCNTECVLSTGCYNCTNSSFLTFNTNLINYTALEANFNIAELFENYSMISMEITNTSTIGTTGAINIAQGGSRIPDALLINVLDNYKLLYIYRESDLTNLAEAIKNFTKYIRWLGEHAPKDQPKCGFDTQCNENKIDKNKIYLAIGICIASIITLIITWKIYKVQKYENDISSKASFINIEDIKSTIILKSHIHIGEILKEKGEVNKANGIKKLQAIYQNKTIMLKKLPKERIFITRDISIELKEMRDLEHSNLAKIIGVTIQTPYICIVQNYYKKGSLYDVLLNEDIQLDWVFKNTFLLDIVNGMCALHESPIKLHGHLTSKNCLINHRWVLQISDYGLTEFSACNRSIKAESIEKEQGKYESLLWTAPENINIPQKVSKAGDVYSFGIIIAEIINRKAPYYEHSELRPSDIIHYVKKRCIPPFRPHVTLQTGLEPKLLDIMNSCQSELAEERPTFKEVKLSLKTIFGDRTDILDNMIEMMEKYSSDLNKAVKERSEMYKKEKIKSNELLYRCVPAPIAEELLEGSTIEPQHLSLVSLLVVKLENFNKICEMLSPQKAINVINDFYKMVEKVLLADECKSIFKLISIREEIVLCSNIKGFKITSEAADLARIAVKISIELSTYQWRYIKHSNIKLSMVIHSGSATGVVIGNKVPVYSIFGNIINYARSLSDYVPINTIVVTENTTNLLRNDKNYVFEYAGENEDIEKIAPSFLKEIKSIGVAFPDWISDLIIWKFPSEFDAEFHKWCLKKTKSENSLLS
ncbi:atrial natriuretic peptide receptor 1 isoform X1 [Hydra vulgaris]|uniref:atrial natriuretic peptide receptor 1 isoform X1 n=1 Tax=Hydra vulgaris TaxID=6087 RepID=UPI001F5F7075|nr:atrial natriuretic peptide receptor 1 isoform X1 [Hydra vulgaris]